MADLRECFMLRHEAALVSSKLTRGYPGGQPTHRKSLCLISSGLCSRLRNSRCAVPAAWRQTSCFASAQSRPTKGFMPHFGDMPLWHSLASCAVILYTSPYPYVTNVLLWAHGRSVASQPSSMEGGTSFHLDTGYPHPDPLVTRCDRAAPRGVRVGRHHGADHPARAVDADPRPLSAVCHPGAAHP